MKEPTQKPLSDEKLREEVRSACVSRDEADKIHALFAAQKADAVKQERERIINELKECHHSSDAIRTANEFEKWLLQALRGGKP